MLLASGFVGKSIVSSARFLEIFKSNISNRSPFCRRFLLLGFRSSRWTNNNDSHHANKHLTPPPTIALDNTVPPPGGALFSTKRGPSAHPPTGKEASWKYYFVSNDTVQIPSLLGCSAIGFGCVASFKVKSHTSDSVGRFTQTVNMLIQNKGRGESPFFGGSCLLVYAFQRTSTSGALDDVHGVAVPRTKTTERVFEGAIRRQKTNAIAHRIGVIGVGLSPLQ